MIAVADVLNMENRGRGGYLRDRPWDRPLIMQADGTRRPYVASSGATKLLTDTTGLEFWQRAKSIRGVAHDDDLVARVRALGDPWDDLDKAGKATLRAIFAEADVIAETHRGRDEGTAIHAAWEQAVRGEPYDARYEPNVAAIRRALAEAGLTPDPAFVEVAIVNDELGMAGTCDMLLARGDRHYVGDLKTGSTVAYSSIEHPGQLAAYAGGVLYDPYQEQRLPTPDIDQAVGFIIHAPAGTTDCTIYRADLVAGRRACLLSNVVREMRREADKDGWLSPVENHAALAAGLGADRVAVESLALRARLQSAVEAGAKRMAWPAGVPLFRDGGPTTWEQLLAVEACVLAAEREVGAPFAAKLPADPNAVVALRIVGTETSGGGADAVPPAPRPAPGALDRLKELHDSLPEDLKQAAYGAVVAAGISSDRRTWTTDHLPTVETILANAVAEHGKRKARLASIIADLDDDGLVAVLLRAATGGAA